MDIKVVKTDGSHYQYKSKKKRIYKKWLKKHIVSSCIFSNVTPNKVTMNEGKDGVTIDANGLLKIGSSVTGGTELTVTAKSVFNTSVTDTATITVGGVITPMITTVLHAYFDLFSGFIQTTVFISLTTILLGAEVPDEGEDEI